MSPNPARLRAAGSAVSKSAGGFDIELPRSLKAERRGEIAILFLARPQKRNAIDDPTVSGIEAFFAALPDAIKAVVLAGEGEHFCSGLDLTELTSRDVAQGIAHSESWHRAFARIYSAEEGQAIGISHYLVPAGAGLAKGIELAQHIARNAPMTNFAVTHVLPRIAGADAATGYLMEALTSAIAQGDEEAKSRLKAFLEKRAPKTARS